MTSMIIAGLRKGMIGVALLASTLALSLTSLTSAYAGPALLLDAGSGRVLYEDQAGEPWFPASVTKLMTTYVVLKEVSAGRLSLDTPLTVSANAAKVQPSKMGFKPGTVVTIDNALKMMLVKSANDLAVVLAEGVAGSVDGFAAAMNFEARRLGMLTSNFTNPHGLYDPSQRVSARDLALLARALLNEFPQYRSYFGIGGVQLGDRVYRNTNGLIGRYPGAEGMKTGFICASGFNVVATATRGNQQLIAVLLGERNATARTIRAAQLFDLGFSGRYAGTRQLEEIAYVTDKATPDIREIICGKGRGNLADDDNAFVQASMGDDSSAVASQNGSNQTSFTRIEGSRPGTLIKRADLAPIPVFTGLTPEPKVIMASKGKNLPDSAQAFAETDASSTALSGSAPIALQSAIKPAPKKQSAGKQKATKQTASAKDKAKSKSPPPRP